MAKSFWKKLNFFLANGLIDKISASDILITVPKNNNEGDYMSNPKIGEICASNQIPIGAVFQACDNKGKPLQAYYVKDTHEWVFPARRLGKNKWKRAGGAGGKYIGNKCKYIAKPENVEPDPPDMIRPFKATVQIS